MGIVTLFFLTISSNNLKTIAIFTFNFTAMTYEEGLELAKKYNLEVEYNDCINDNLTPEEALLEWDIL